MSKYNPARVYINALGGMYCEGTNTLNKACT